MCSLSVYCVYHVVNATLGKNFVSGISQTMMTASTKNLETIFLATTLHMIIITIILKSAV